MSEPPPITRMPYDDRPYGRAADMPPEMGAPLAVYEGAEPPAPLWFRDALAHAPERTFTQSGDVALETLTWGEVGKPGLLLVHGNSAHADWWSFMAPYLAKDYRVAAFSLAGMGDSGWRERYDFDDYDRDMEAVARAAGLHEGGRKPVYIGHSFGGAQVYYAAWRRPELIHAAMIIDTSFRVLPGALIERRRARMADIRALPEEKRSSRVYPDVASALARFRFSPAQPVRKPYVADYIARRSLKEVPTADGQGVGWTWKFDPWIWEKIDRSKIAPFFTELPALTMPGAFLHGEHSNFRLRQQVGEVPPMPDDFQQVEIPDSHHHIMVDHPLALVAAIRAVLAGWRA